MKISALFLTVIFLISSCGTAQSPRYSAKISDFYGETWQLHGFQQTEDGVDITQQPLTGENFTIVFKDDGTIGGKAHCNSYFGKYAVEDEQLALLNIGATKMYCGDNSLDTEFFRALENTRRYELFRSEAVTPDKYRLILHYGAAQALVFLKDTL